MTERRVYDERSGIVHWADWQTTKLFSIALCDELLIATETRLSESSVTCKECIRRMRERINERVNTKAK